MNVHSALPEELANNVPVPSTAVILERIGLVIPNRLLTVFPKPSLMLMVTVRLSKLLVSFPLSISNVPRNAERVMIASWLICSLT